MGIKFFAYSVSEENGSLVITVSGTLAEQALQRLRGIVESGQELSIRSLLSPLFPIGHFLSAPAVFRREIEVPGNEAAEDSGRSRQPDQSATGQEIDQAFTAFQQQMEDFRNIVQQLKADKEAQ